MKRATQSLRYFRSRSVMSGSWDPRRPSRHIRRWFWRARKSFESQKTVTLVMEVSPRGSDAGLAEG
jgi:hypothetical protein